MRNLLLIGFVAFFMAFMMLPSQKVHAGGCILESELDMGETKACVYLCTGPSSVEIISVDADKPCPRTITR